MALTEYVDTLVDRPVESSDELPQRSLFETAWGFGRPCFSESTILAHQEDDVPLYFLMLDHCHLKMDYNPAEGIPVAFLVHKDTISSLLQKVRNKRCAKKLYRNFLITEKGEDAPSQQMVDEGWDKWSIDQMLSLREQLQSWLIDLLRSPLPEDDKQWFLAKVGTAGKAKESNLRPPSQRKEDDHQGKGHVVQVIQQGFLYSMRTVDVWSMYGHHSVHCR